MSRKKNRQSVKNSNGRNPNLIIKGDLKPIKPLTINQDKFYKLYNKGTEAILLHGVAGTGKTYIALYNALNEVLKETSEFEKIVIVRSAVPSRDIGFLPGNEKEKTEIYSRPYQDICSDLIPRFGKIAYMKLMEQGVIEFMTTSYVRGLTMDNSIVIVDECQNMNDMEINSIMTRIGKHSKIIFCGDFRQTDLYRKQDMSGLNKFISITKHMSTFKMLEFEITDIVRSNLVKEYILARLAYDDMVLMAY